MSLTRTEPALPDPILAPPAPPRAPAPEPVAPPPSSSSGGGTIRRRVARILALPAVVVLLLLGLVAAGQVQDYRTSATTARSVTLTLAVQDLVHELQTERGVAAGVLGGNNSFLPELKPARAQVDEQRVAVERLLADGGAAERRVSSALRQLDGLAAVRSATDSGSAGRAATFAYYTDRITALTSVDSGLDNSSDEQLRRGVASLQALQELTEATAQERAFLNGVFSAGGFAEGEFVQFAAMRADRDSALERFRRFATPEQLTALNFVYDTGAARVTSEFEKVASAAADGRHIVVNPQSWWSGLTTVLDDLRQLEEHVGSTIQVRAHDLQQGSAQRIGGLLGFVALCFAGSIYLAALASTSITRPLALLASEADDVAADRLPEAVRRVQAADPESPPRPPAPVQVPARATEEIRSVAGALDRLQAAAYDLATEQALQRRDTIESLANLGRRNQNLIRRQLGFITSLEREEIDPASLANLFELDHLATRMRRNAASLLVLVDASSPRQWSQAVSVADVIRAAVSEVEEYRRVSLRRVDDAMVSGSAIGSIAHLLSELIENGLTFSPPDTEVEVQGRRLSDGYLIAITDQGVGMSPEHLREANSRLRGEGDFIGAPTRFLGHFVVGKLARDTGIDVELLPSPVTGVTARVTLPASLLSSPATVEVSASDLRDLGELGELGELGTSDGDAQPSPGRARHSLPSQPRITPPGRLALAPPPAEAGGPRPAASAPLSTGTGPLSIWDDEPPATSPAPPADPLTDPLTDRHTDQVPPGPAAPQSPAALWPPTPAAGTVPVMPAVPGEPAARHGEHGPADSSGPDHSSDPDRTPPSGLPLSAHPAWGPPPATSWPPSWDVPRGTTDTNGTTGTDGTSTGTDGTSTANGFGSHSEDSTAPGTLTGSGTLTGPPTSHTIASEQSRTRNGLRKRTPRTQRSGHEGHQVLDLDAVSTRSSASTRSDASTRSTVPGRTTVPGQTAASGRTTTSARAATVVNDSPAGVSSRLTALRSGIQRGKNDAATQPTSEETR